MRKQSLILGVTGSIASGKSLVAALFQKCGAAVVSADQLAREIVRPGSVVLQQLVERFGAVVLAADGSLDRDRLAQMVFSDQQARIDVNRITHPAIGQLALERLSSLASSGVPLVVYEAPLLFEAGAEQRVDRVLVVKVDPETQLQRLMDREGLSPIDAQQRVDAQLSQEEKLARADYVIDNSGSIEATQKQVETLWRQLTGHEE
ncbi:MAG TPA: dephospho-CoA kinase [Geopsychrobacteraceae bacterium]|nr:dephospho-CoA kinase [Geopsychrobacteraceae bacterium]